MSEAELGKRLSTGNEFISIPDVSVTTAGVGNIGFLYDAFRACIELHGSDSCPLIRPTVRIDGHDLFDGEVASELVSYWIPQFEASHGPLRAIATYFAPLERRGFVCVVTVENTSDREANFEAGWHGCWESTHHAANRSKMMAGVKHASISSYRPGVPVIEYRGHTPLFALAFVSEEVVPANMRDSEGRWSAGEWSTEGLIARPGFPLYWELVDKHTLGPGERKVIPLYIGIGLEEVSAIASAEELRLQSWERTAASLKSWLDARIIDCDDDYFKRMVNVNSFYNYFYSQGVALDTEQHVVATARSARSEYCASYGDRDAMLWSMPAVLQVNWAQARKMLIHSFTRQLSNIGIRSRYINGIVLEPGLQLDQLCAPIVALHYYVQVTGDMSILFDRRVQHGVNTIQQTLAAQRHPDVVLFETLLLPSGDPSRHPYVCYSNVMVWRALKDAARLYDRIRDLDRAFEADRLANQVKDAILKSFIVDGPFGKMFARGIDMAGGFELGDDPAGSLQMLSYHGFCVPEDPVYAHTVEWIHSEHNPFSNWTAPFEQPSACGASGPSVVSVVNDLLTGRKEQAIDFLRRASLDDGVACGSLDRTTGKCVGGRAYASAAGYLAFGLKTALDMQTSDTAAVPQQRRPSEVLYQPPPPEANQTGRKARL